MLIWCNYFIWVAVFLFIVVRRYITIDIGGWIYLKLWLGDVGEYMISFTKLILVYCLVLAIGNPITIIMQAAKKVKLYHGIVDSFVLLTLPLSYVFLKFGCPPEVSLLVAVVMLMIAHIIRLFVLLKLWHFLLKSIGRNLFFQLCW